MIWLPLLALVAAAFLIAAFVVKIPRNGWAAFAAALLFGFAGYAVQGSPGHSGAPKQAASDSKGPDFVLVDVRREMFNPAQPPSRLVTIADGFARQGRFEDAANILSAGVSEDPNDAEAWLALAIALVEHADGALTPAASYAFGRAETAMPGHPGAAYFLGVSLLRLGRPADARALWVETLAKMPADAMWRAQMEERLARLDQLIAQMGLPQ